MSSICSSRFPIPCACRAIALSLVALALGSPAAAQRDEGVVDQLARLLAAADARVYDTALFREALRHPDPFVRRQAALAAGRIGDPQAVDPLVAALADSGPAVQAAVAFALGLVKSRRAIAPLLALARAVPAVRQGPPQTEAVSAIAKTGGDEGAAALGDLLGSGAASTAVQRTALLEAWRLGARAPIPTLMREARNSDPVARRNAIYALARLRTTRGVTALVAALTDSEVAVRAVALRGLSRALTDSAQLSARDVASRIAPLLADGDSHVRVNALRALASFHDSTLAALALPLTADPDVNVVVQAETTLGVLGGARAVAALQAGAARGQSRRSRPDSRAGPSRCVGRRRSRWPRRTARPASRRRPPSSRAKPTGAGAASPPRRSGRHATAAGSRPSSRTWTAAWRSRPYRRSNASCPTATRA